MNSIALIPHEDDEALFLAYTLMREKPLVFMVTDSYIQEKRGDNITAAQRRAETEAALRVLGCPVIFAGVPDDVVDYRILYELFGCMKGFGTVYYPAIQGGNPHHDLISEVARQFWPEGKQYTTYTKTELYTTGSIEVVPTPEEIDLKNKALDCYTSQLNLGSTRPHFDAVRGKSEWFM